MPHTPAPLHCRPEAYRLLIEQLPVLETTQGLVRAAVAIAAHEVEDATVEETERRINQIISQIRTRLRSTDPRAVLAHAHEVLFDELHFTGNAHDYYNPRNSYLPIALTTRRGLPITLALLYKAVVEPLGVPVVGINTPGHFLVGVDFSEGPARPVRRMLIDPFFSGKLVTRAEAFQRIEELAGRTVTPDDDLLLATPHRDWILRMLRNLIGVFDRLDRRECMAAMLEMQTAIERGSE